MVKEENELAKETKGTMVQGTDQFKFCCAHPFSFSLNPVTL